MNFLGIGDFIPLIIVPYVLVLITQTKFSKTFMISLVTLFTFSLVYSLMVFYYGFSASAGILGKLIYPASFLVLGYKLAGEKLNYKKNTGYLLIFVVFLSSYGFLSVLKTESIYGNMDYAIMVLGGRLVVDLWGNNLISATSLNSFLSLGLALLPVLFLSVRKKEISKFHKLLMLLIFSFSVYATIQISSRTGILIVFSSLLISFLFTEGLNKNKIKRILIAGVILTLGLIAFSRNVLNLRSYVESTFIYQRLISTNLQNDSRVSTWWVSFKGLFENPLGGRETNLHLNYAHNLWLDVGYDAGIIPFLILVVFTIFALVVLMKFIKYNHPIFVKMIVLSMMTAFMVIFMFEPVLQGLGAYFTIFCYLLGTIHKMNFLYVKQN